MSSLRLVLSDGTARDYSILNFCREFGLDTNSLKCGKFHPRLRFKSELVEIIHFTDFRFLNGSFLFDPELIELYCPNKAKIKFSIITPSKILIF